MPITPECLRENYLVRLRSAEEGTAQAADPILARSTARLAEAVASEPYDDAAYRRAVAAHAELTVMARRVAAVVGWPPEPEPVL